MTRHIRWRQKPCERCGEMVTTNGLGRDHERWCRTATPEQRAALAKRKPKRKRTRDARVAGPALPERFEASYIPEPNSGCWLGPAQGRKGSAPTFLVRR